MAVGDAGDEGGEEVDKERRSKERCDGRNARLKSDERAGMVETSTDGEAAQ